MKKIILSMLVLTAGLSTLSYSARTREEGIRRKKNALENKYQNCMKYSARKSQCAKYREIKNNIK